MASAANVNFSNHFANLNACIYSGSTYLGVHNTTQSNVNSEMTNVEKHARKAVFGVLGNAAIVVASAIETLARAIFGICAYIYGVASSASEERKNFLLSVGFEGAAISGGNVVACAKAIYAICSNWNGVEPLNYNTLFPLSIDENDLRRMFAQAPARPARNEGQGEQQGAPAIQTATAPAATAV